MHMVDIMYRYIIDTICTIYKLITVYNTFNNNSSGIYPFTILLLLLYIHYTHYYTIYTLHTSPYLAMPYIPCTFYIHYIHIIYYTVFISYKLLINTIMYTRLYTPDLSRPSPLHSTWPKPT